MRPTRPLGLQTLPGEISTIAIMARNHRGFVESLIAANRLGADVLLLNTSFAGPALSEVIRREGADVVIYDEEFAPTVDRALADAPDTVRIVAWTDADGHPRTVEGMIRASCMLPKNGTKWIRRYERYPARVVTSRCRDGNHTCSAYSPNVIRPAAGTIHLPSDTWSSDRSAARSASRSRAKVPAERVRPCGSRYRPVYLVRPSPTVRVIVHAIALHRVRTMYADMGG